MSGARRWGLTQRNRFETPHVPGRGARDRIPGNFNNCRSIIPGSVLFFERSRSDDRARTRGACVPRQENFP
ncbi:hypothetical protein FTUN_8935 [Frigoriglobus tundricola]|uniref:Uncharacterized protein n=1 Tax=Frigoriglobus tundricola TaxID=2774151 RepID=A0A6M5Z7T1_9BACT|nr:hypothetical protein FTUN_8935 [Frigoriglobus tundricola]